MVIKKGLVISKKFLGHNNPYHLEKPERIKAIFEYIKDSGLLEQFEIIEPRKAKKEEILLCHSEEHFDFVYNKCKSAPDMLDGDTFVVYDSFDTALYAAGGVLEAVDCVFSKKIDRIFCCVRPPGHHATKDHSMGFCIFNNVAIGASYAMEKFKLKKILIIDFDLHHGNGTQEIFYNTDRVFYLSIHQYPYYPGTGSKEETGEGKGKGFTLNVPLPAGTEEKI